MIKWFISPVHLVKYLEYDMNTTIVLQKLTPYMEPQKLYVLDARNNIYLYVEK